MGEIRALGVEDRDHVRREDSDGNVYWIQVPKTNRASQESAQEEEPQSEAVEKGAPDTSTETNYSQCRKVVDIASWFVIPAGLFIFPVEEAWKESEGNGWWLALLIGIAIISGAAFINGVYCCCR